MDGGKEFQQAQVLRDNQEIPQAISHYQQVRDAALAAGDTHQGAEAAHMIGVAHYQVGEFTEAEAQLAIAEQEFSARGEQDFVGMVLRDRGLVALKSGETERARELMQQSIDTLRETDHRGHLGMSMVKLGVIMGKEGKRDEAEKQIREGIQTIEGTQDVFFLSTGWFDLAKVQKESGDVSAAQDSATKSLELLNQVGPEDEFKKRRTELVEFLKENE